MANIKKVLFLTWVVASLLSVLITMGIYGADAPEVLWSWIWIFSIPVITGALIGAFMVGYNIIALAYKRGTA